MNGLYQVSNTGKIKSLKYKKEKILKPSFDKNGYTSLNLCKNGKISHRTIHRLVAETFITNTNNYPCVNHKDENPKNNNVENLEWCTYKYNMNYGTGFERRSKNNKIPINQYDKSNNFIKRWSSAIDIQNEIGINQGSIIACCRNKLKTAGGYVWKYAEFNIRQKSKKELIKEIDNLKYELQQEKEKNQELIEHLQKDIESWKKYCNEQENDITLKNNKICDLEFKIEKQSKEIEELEEYKHDTELTKIACCTAQNCEALSNCIKLGRELQNADKKWKNKIKAKIGKRMQKNNNTIHNAKLKHGKDYVYYDDVQEAKEENRICKEILQSLLEKE